MFSLLVTIALAGEAPTRYHYKGPENVCFCDEATVVAEIQKNPDGRHRVWIEGWGAWKNWSDVPALRAAVGGAPSGWSYAMDGGTVQTLSASEIAARVSENPTATHLVWKEGMEQWTSARDVAEIADQVRTTPTEAPAAAAPPPLPPMPPPDMEPTQTRVPPAPDRTNEPPRPDPGVRREEGPMTPPNPPPETHGVDMHLGNRVHFGAETRVELAWDDLQDALLYEDFSIPTFRIERFVPHMEATLAPFATARGSVWITQRDVVTATSTTLADVETEAAGGFVLVPHDLFVDLHGGKKLHHQAVIGVDAPIFGGIESWEANWRFGGLETWQAPVVALGHVPYRDVGLRYGLGGERWDIAAQVQNGNGIGDFDINEGKDLSGRLRLRPIEAVSIEVSALYGPRALYSDATLMLGHGLVDAHTRSLRARAEAWVGSSTENARDDQRFGAAVAVGGTAWLSTEALERIDVDGRFFFDDPDLVSDGTAFDTEGTWTYGYAVVVDAGWRVAAPHRLSTGIVFASEVPELLEDPVRTSLALQQTWSF